MESYAPQWKRKKNPNVREQDKEAHCCHFCSALESQIKQLGKENHHFTHSASDNSIIWLFLYNFSFFDKCMIVLLCDKMSWPRQLIEESIKWGFLFQMVLLWSSRQGARMQTGKHDTGAVAHSLCLIHMAQGRKRADCECYRLLKFQSLLPVTHLPRKTTPPP